MALGSYETALGWLGSENGKSSIRVFFDYNPLCTSMLDILKVIDDLHERSLLLRPTAHAVRKTQSSVSLLRQLFPSIQLLFNQAPKYIEQRVKSWRDTQVKTLLLFYNMVSDHIVISTFVTYRIVQNVRLAVLA